MMMSAAAAPISAENQVATIFQYTVEAYKMFEKLSELLPNPMAAHTYENLAEDEREIRTLIEMKYSDPSVRKTTVGLEKDLRFSDALEGDLSFSETTEYLITREKTMEKWLLDASKNASESDRTFFAYLAGTKRAHLVYLQRELDLLRLYPDWYKREDAESLVVHGRSAAARLGV
jgi:rubrerythrin